ncbi:MAG: DUF4280 domain-containing protein [Lachnospiraceae bacterium]|nr:DUF4280 domain-containing protein [Lachnospiraceae bacterium]
MGILSWLFKEEEQPENQPENVPETLVFGAELKCPCGFKHSFLIVSSDNLNTDNLPIAHVWDSKAFVNINPFGTCTLGLECEQMIELEDRWENIEPQNVLMGDDEVITMKSTLTCKKSGMWIVPVNSGQDGQAAARILREEALVREIKQKYPGLLEILKDPYGSLYLHDGMCEKAVHFLEDSLKRNGDMEMASLYGEYDMEGQLIRSALGHLLVTCDVSRLELFVEGLSTRGVINGMEEVPGWDARILNEEMLEMVRREYPETAERIETKSYYRWQEENKKTLSVLGQMATEVAYGLMFYECMIAEKPYLERIERERAYRATKEAGGETVNEDVGRDSGVTFSSDEKLVSHFEKHGDEFKGMFNSADEYLQGAQEVIQKGYKVEYMYKGEVRTGYVQFMGNNSRGNAKFAFVGTNNEGYITTFHTESGKTFWKMLNGENISIINPM